MDVVQFGNALVVINNLSTIAAVGCVLPTYFLYLRPQTYRLILFLGIACGLTTLAAAVSTTSFPPPPARFVVEPVLLFSPFTLVLIAILARIKRLNSVCLWSTVVLACVVADWAGICGLILVLS